MPETAIETENVDRLRQQAHGNRVVAVGYWYNKDKEIVITRHEHVVPSVHPSNNGTIHLSSIPVLRIFERRVFVDYYGEPIEPTVFPGFDRSKILDPREADIRPGSYYRYARCQTVYVAAIERCIEIAGQPSRRPWVVLQFKNGDLMTSSLLSLARIGFTREPN